MLASTPNSEAIRVVIIIAFAVLSLVLRAAKKQTAPRPKATVPTPAPFEAVREAMRQAAAQNRARQQQRPFQLPSHMAEPPQFRDSFEQPPAIQPESPMLPSLLLIALAICLCLMAYQFFAH